MGQGTVTLVALWLVTGTSGFAVGNAARHTARLPPVQLPPVRVGSSIRCSEGEESPLAVKERDEATTSYRSGMAKLAPEKLPSLALPRVEKLSSADRSGYIVLGLCCAIATISSLDRVMMSVAILPMSAEMLYTDTTKGLIAAAFTTGYFLFFVPAGVVAATYSPSATLTVGLIVWSIAQAATPTAAYLGLAPLLACRAVMGVGESCTFPSIQAIAARWVPKEYRSRFWGVLTAFFNVGTVVAYLASPTLIENYGWSFSFIAYGAAGIALTAVWAAFGSDSPATPDLCVPDECPLPELEEAAEEVQGALLAAPSTPSPPSPPSPAIAASAASSTTAMTALERARALPWGEIASSKVIWAMTAAAIASNYFLYFAIAWLPTYFSYQFDLDTSAASAASVAPFAAAAVGCFIAGNAADALVERGVELTNVRKAAGLVSTLGPAAALLALASGNPALDYNTCQAIFIGALALHAFNIAGYGVGVQDISTKSASLISGVTAGIGVMTGAASQVITGTLLDSNGRDFIPVFLIAAGVQIFGAVAFTCWWDSERQFE